MASVKNIDADKHNDNSKPFLLIWLDAGVDRTVENQAAQDKLRSIIKNLKTFSNLNECQDNIISHSGKHRIALIVSGRLGQKLIPEIHHLEQLSSVYIYCGDKAANEKWANQFTKVKGVFVQLDRLINQIKTEEKHEVLTEEPMPMNFYSVNSDENQSTSRLNGQFINFLLLIDVLIRIEYNESDKRMLIKRCMEEYHDNDPQLCIIREFQYDYIPRKALWWYTRDSFLFTMLNKALRVQDTELLFLYRFLIRDIYEQLKTNHCKESVIAYRYQSMSRDEFKTLQNSIGQIISINSFFSTSSSSATALRYADHSITSNEFNRILFIIEANPLSVKSKPFADISSLSYFSQEHEVLFMIGCIFRLINIQWDNSQKIWKILMKLVGDDQNNLKNLFNHLKNEYGNENETITMKNYGDVLRQMGKYDLAKKVYLDLNKTCSPDDSSFDALCFSIGLMYKESNDFDGSLRWFRKALDKKLRMKPIDYSHIAGLHCCIGNIFLEKNDYIEAKNCFDEAMKCFQHANAIDHPDTASLYYGLARIKYFKKEYTDALNYYKKSMIILEKHLPCNHPDMATNYSSIGDVYRRLSNYTLAMQCYRKSLEIGRKSLPLLHPNIASSYQRIGLVYEYMNSFTEALDSYQKAAVIYKQVLPSTHPQVIKIEKFIQRATSKLN